MAQERMPYEEVKRTAHEIYEANIRDRLAPGDEERYVKIDVLSGDYEIGDNSATAGRILRERRPDAVIHTLQRHKSETGYLRNIDQVGGDQQPER